MVRIVPLPLRPVGRLLPLLAFCLAFASPSSSQPAPSPQRGPTPDVSGGGEAAVLAPRVLDIEELDGSPTGGVLGGAAYVPGVAFDAYNFVDNSTETGGYLFIPPDPCGAAGTDRVIAVVNVGIECRDKTGTLLFRDSLKDFFTALGGSMLGTFTFDPKVVYDEHAGRFVIVTLERTDVAQGGASNESRIHVAVSKTSSPASATAADWWVTSINSKLNVSGVDCWADYPGLEVDEEAVYITMNFFNFGSPTTTYAERLYIVHKGLVGGFYAGGAATVTLHDPYASSGLGGWEGTTMPCQVHGASGVATGVGTYLLNYGGLTYGGAGNPEALIVIRVDNPTGAVAFTGEFVTIGDIEDIGGAFGWPALPDAPQSGTATLIEVNDRRALDAVWRSGYIYLTTTINPNASDPANQGTTTAHVIKLDATAVTGSGSPAGLITLAAETNVGAEDIAATTYTFFPSVAVNNLNHVKVGFAGCASTLYGSAFAAEIDQSTFTPNPTATVRAGVDYYIRTFGSGRNRWGDYSGISVDPADGTTFWVFNQWAMTRGTPTSGEDGRWATAWLSCVQQPTLDFGDAPPPYPTLLAMGGANHTVVPGFFMGAMIDAEADGIPHPTAQGDDFNNAPDEDGLIGASIMTAGQPGQFQITASAPGWLDIWIDFNANGSWLDPGEQVYSGPAGAGVNIINWMNPVTATPGNTFTRIRFNAAGPLPPTGPAPNGEVEDYMLYMNPAEMDFGDAPDAPYPTFLAGNGARHTIVPGVFLGNQIDAEPDGQPNPTATGDDVANLPDEDGVAWVTAIVPGGTAQVDIVASVGGWVDAWIDFDVNGIWDPTDQIYSGAVFAGLNSIMYPVPAGALPGATTYARVRYNLNGPLAVTGAATDGEVEDYQVAIEQGRDFGDAPDLPYPTLLASGGAYHTIVPGVFLGAAVDAEADGQPHPNALGDDLAGVPDEDGVVWTTPMVPNQPSSFDVFASVPGWVDAWVDFDLSGVWDPPELIYSGPVVPGLNTLGFAVPATAVPGMTFARVRFNTGGALLPVGPGPDGEVEDYEVRIDPPQLDFGDAPDLPYPTLLASNGARHILVPGIFLGSQIDAEADGQPNASATGDDLANLADEDGVTWVTAIVVGQAAQMDVVASVNGQLDAWIDFDQNGSWDPGDQIYSGFVAAGLNSIIYAVPPAALPGATYARVRYNANGNVMAPTGQEIDGEVEDYQVVVQPAPDLDFGDAPDPTYPTLLASGGAHHVITAGVFLGAQIDAEADGQPHPTALGDDLANLADEDGVTWAPLVPGQATPLNVVASVPGWLDLWIDLDASGAWDPADLVFSGPVAPGPNLVNVFVPGSATVGFTFARARYNLGGALPPTGYAPDGEVEDYHVRIDPPALDFGDAPDASYQTLLASNGPRHVINTGVMMGAAIDPEADGQPTALADGDDTNGVDDEDGVAFVGPIVVGLGFQVDVTVSVNGWLDLWIDYDRDGTFDHPAELVISGAVSAGLNSLSPTVPAGTPTGWTYARARYNLTGALTPVGFAPDGEVEDYQVRILDVGGTPGETGRLGIGAAFPNPFSDRVTLNFGLAVEEEVVVKVYGMDGTLVATLAQERFGPGQYTLQWDGRNDRGQQVTSGVYFFRLQVGKTTQNQKVLFVR